MNAPKGYRIDSNNSNLLHDVDVYEEIFGYGKFDANIQEYFFLVISKNKELGIINVEYHINNLDKRKIIHVTEYSFPEYSKEHDLRILIMDRSLTTETREDRRKIFKIKDEIIKNLKEKVKKYEDMLGKKNKKKYYKWL